MQGKVIPVVDLRLKFGMEEVEPTEKTCIVAEVKGEKDKTLVGIVVDSVSEVFEY
ncbi:MAG: chemotaxis protein CheW [Thermodesulfobacteriota bacterium]